MRDVEEVAKATIDCGFKLHDGLGPGLLESVYEALLEESLKRLGFAVERQKIVPIVFGDIHLAEGFRVDLFVEGMLVVELKSVERFAPVHAKQVLTYLRVMHLPLGLLMNFGLELFKDGVQRVVNNNKSNFAPSRLRVSHDRAARTSERSQ